MTEMLREPEVLVAPEPTRGYATLLARSETVRALILDGTLDPMDGLALVVWPTEAVQRAERELARRQAKRRFSPEAQELALSLVAGGASYRLAAAAALGDERYRVTVWRWARRQEGRP